MLKKNNIFSTLYAKLIFDKNAEYNIDELKKANDIAIDIAKLLITLSTGVITISISMQKDFFQNPNKAALKTAWILQTFSIVCGILFLYSMLKLYRNWAEASLVDTPSILFGLFQFLTFLFGLVFLIIAM